MAQNVYSLNVVGYYNITIPANSFAMIANQLNTTNNTIASLIPTPPDFTELYKFSGGYSGYLYDGEWTPDGNATLNPGEGAFIRNVTGSPLTLTFVGEVMQGSLTNPLPAGFSIRSSMVPQAGLVTTTLGLPAADFDELYTFSGGYSGYLYDGEWTPNEPNIAVGQAFWVRKVGGAANWVRNFTVQ